MAPKRNSGRAARRETPEKREPPMDLPAQSPASGASSWPVWPLVALAALIAANVVMMFDLAGLHGALKPDEPEALRRVAILFVLAPDRLLELCCGGKLADFSLVDRLPILLGAGAILLGAWIAGRLALDLLRITPLLDRLEREVFAAAVGLNLLSLFALAVGLAGGLHYRWLFVGLFLALVVAGAIPIVLRGSGVGRRASRGEGDGTAGASSPRLQGDDRRWLWCLLAAVPYALVIILGAMLPPWEYDVREYHLQVPREWFEQGKIGFLPHNIYGNMPLGSEMMALWGMEIMVGDHGWWHGAVVGKTVMACYSLIAAAGLVAFGRRLHSLGAGVAAAIAYLSTPWITNVAAVGYNEGPAALYCLCAFHALFLAWRAAAPSEAHRLCALAGFCAGAAVACKYPPALFLVVPLLGWVVLGDLVKRMRIPGRHDIAGHFAPGHLGAFSIRQAIVGVVVFLLGVTAGCGLWLGKNAALSGNPTYPLLYRMFDGRTRTPEKDRQWTRVHSPQPDEQGRRFTVRSLARESASLVWRTKGASLTLLPLAAAAWLASGRRGFVALIFLWLLFVFATWWLLTHRLDRFLVPAIPLVALMAGLGVTALPHSAWRTTSMTLLIAGAIAQFPYVSHPMQGDTRYFAPLSRLRHDDMRLSLGGRRLSSAQRLLNTMSPPPERVLLVGDAEPFDWWMPTIYNTCFDDCQFERLMKGKTRSERLAALREAGISHVFCHWFHLRRYRSPGNYGYTSDYVTPELVHRELVAEQALLRKVPLDMPPEFGELFEVASQ